MRLRVTSYGEPILRQTGTRITAFDAALKTFAENMIETMYAEKGIGLAAHQAGQAIQLCVIDVRPPENMEVPFYYQLDGSQPPLDLIMPMVIVNPEVKVIDQTEEIYEEGCLSFPRVTGKVSRPAGVHCDFQDLDGQPHTIECSELLGRCILHEVDHLNGTLFIDKMDPRDLRKHATKIKQLKRTSRDFLKGK